MRNKRVFYEKSLTGDAQSGEVVGMRELTIFIFDLLNFWRRVGSSILGIKYSHRKQSISSSLLFLNSSFYFNSTQLNYGMLPESSMTTA